MAVVSNVVSANLRLVDDEGRGFNSFRQVDPSVLPIQFRSFAEAVGSIRGENPAAIFLNVTRELKEEE